ncbi:MAG: hypothetical protein IT431_04165 [Phycisphaerales bacterium]|nr:hypothetical protein [Phycisphaerales bacterium]
MLREVFVVVGIAAVGLSMLMVGAGQSRKSAGLAGSLANLKRIGEVGANYAADYEDFIWAFSWQAGDTSSQYQDLRDPYNAMAATAYQATDILRRLYDESVDSYSDRYGPYWISTLVLADYLGESLPMEWVVSPGDEVRLEWQADPDNPPDLDDQGGTAWARVFCGFGSSYEYMPAFFAPDERANSQNTLAQYAGQHSITTVPNVMVNGSRRVSEISFPGHKVQMAERASFFFGPKPVFYMLPQARVPVLMADGSASPRTTGEANSSFHPNGADDPDRVSITDYLPNPIFEVPTLSGTPRDNDIETHYKWTRRGLRGIDFAGERAE